LIDELVHVSASLREDGGGTAHYGRVFGRTLRRYAAARGLSLRGLHLPASDGHPALDGYESFRDSRLRLAARVAALQVGPRRRRRLFLFDHPGPARIQGHLPAALRARYAVVVHGIDVWRPLPSDQSRALAGADLLLPVSRTTVERARPFLPSDCRIEVVHPGIEDSGGAGAVSQAQLRAAGAGFVLIVSRLPGQERYKGHDELIEAWPSVLAGVPAARLVVAGAGDDRGRLEARVRDLGLTEAVAFLGFVDPPTLAELYRRAAVFAMPSRDEGFGLVFVEAMAAGKPCLALAGTAPAEIVVDGETGRLIPAGRPELLAEALASLLGDPQGARRLGEAGRQRFEREFTQAAFEGRLEPLLDRLVVAGRS
jgi:phosphatidylinositol alpha-1,6-mannosyltransferase